MERFAKNGKRAKSFLTIFVKTSILVDWQGFEYVYPSRHLPAQS